MNYWNKWKHYFSKEEWGLWLGSSLAIVSTFLLFDRGNVLTLFASLVGISSLLFNAKGNPIGQVLMVLFSVAYGLISFQFAYYGEMITYLGMTMPMAIVAWIAWVKHPYQGNHAEVQINQLSQREYLVMYGMTVVVTVLFYFILAYFHTANLFWSTLSVSSSFIAVYLTFRRSPLFALAYAGNDLVLILLWSLALRENLSYLSVVVCFIAFFIHDIYGFLNWKRMEQRQQAQVLTIATQD